VTTVTLGDVPAMKGPVPSAEAEAAKELVRLAKQQGLSLTGPDGLLKQFTKNVLESALNEEMTEHLGHEKNRPQQGRESSNVRNGTRPKTVLTEATGQVEIEVPRDRLSRHPGAAQLRIRSICGSACAVDAGAQVPDRWPVEAGVGHGWACAVHDRRRGLRVLSRCGPLCCWDSSWCGGCRSVGFHLPIEGDT
jgi:hypothetical protein